MRQAEKLPEPGIVLRRPPALVILLRARFEDEASRTGPGMHRDGGLKKARTGGVEFRRSLRRGATPDGFDFFVHAVCPHHARW